MRYPEYINDLAIGERERQLMEFVYDQHDGQTDKQGQPYHFHLYHVASIVRPHLRIPAYAHDLIEDTSITYGELEQIGFSWFERCTIDNLTKYDGVSRVAYLERLCRSRAAKQVKIADVMSNLSRLSGLDTETADRLQSKYYETLTILSGVH